MKKIISAILMLAVILTLTACKKTEEEKFFEELNKWVEEAEKEESRSEKVKQTETLPAPTVVKISDITEITVTGISPKLKISLKPRNDLGIKVVCDTDFGKNNQTITLRAEYDKNSLAAKGYELESDTEKYTIGVFDEYVYDISLIDKETKDYFCETATKAVTEYLDSLVVPEANDVYVKVAFDKGGVNIIEKVTGDKIAAYSPKLNGVYAYFLGYDVKIGKQWHYSANAGAIPNYALYYAFEITADVNYLSWEGAGMTNNAEPYRGELSFVLVYRVEEPIIYADGSFSHSGVKRLSDGWGDKTYLNIDDFVINQLNSDKEKYVVTALE